MISSLRVGKVRMQQGVNWILAMLENKTNQSALYSVPRIIGQVWRVVMLVTLMETAIPALFMLSPFASVLIRVLQGAGVSNGIYLVYFFGIAGSLAMLVIIRRLLMHPRTAKTGFVLLALVVVLHLVSVPFYLWGYLSQNTGVLGFATLQVVFPVIAWAYVLAILFRSRGFLLLRSPLPSSLPLKYVAVNVAVLALLVATYPANLVVLALLRHTNFSF